MFLNAQPATANLEKSAVRVLNRGPKSGTGTVALSASRQHPAHVGCSGLGLH